MTEEEIYFTVKIGGCLLALAILIWGLTRTPRYITDVHIPHFKDLSDEDLHAWEFRLYESLAEDDTRELRDIIGPVQARAYYNERGLRLDLAAAAKLHKELQAAQERLVEIHKRIKANKSGDHYFGGATHELG